MALRSSPTASLTAFLDEAAPAFAPDRPFIPSKPERRSSSPNQRLSKPERRRRAKQAARPATGRAQVDDQVDLTSETSTASTATVMTVSTALTVSTTLRVVLPTVLFVAALLLYAVRLGAAHTYSYDEVYHAFTAAEYLEGNPDAHTPGNAVPEPKPNPNVAYEWTHPPLGKLLIAVGIFIFGDEPTGWRAMSTVFGAIGIAVVYFLGWRLTGRWAVGLLAAFLLMMDGLYFSLARTGMLDIFLVTFTTAALLAFHAYLRAPPDEARDPLLFTGLSMGCAIAVKWNGLYASAFIGLVALWRLWRLWSAQSKPHASPAVIRGARQQAIWVPTALIAVPLLVYLASYIPYFATGQTLPEFFDLQRRMFRYHALLDATHPYASAWWTWPLDKRPILLDTMGFVESRVARVYGLGNPLIFWACLPAVAAVTWSWWRTHHRTAVTVLAIGFFGQWLIWMFSPRMAFLNHFLPSVPFGVIAIATLLEAAWRRATRPARAVVRSYLIAVAALFIFFYPIYASVWLDADRFNMRMWFDSWR